jgi:hypothetical protein
MKKSAFPDVVRNMAELPSMLLPPPAGTTITQSVDPPDPSWNVTTVCVVPELLHEKPVM